MSHVAKSLENLTRITTLFRCAAFLALAALSIWNESAEWQSFPGGRAMALTNIGGSSNGFHLLDPNFTQVIFTNELKETRAATNRTLYNGSGLATGDIDGDELIDVVFVGLESQIQVFKNLGGWVFSNVTATSGLRLTNVVCRGVTLADLDGDGALDLLVTANHRGVLSWRNDGQGKFTEITREAGTASSFGSLTVTLADVDGNGSLDLYVANNRSEDIRDQGEVRLSMVGGKRTVPAALRNRLVLFGEQLLEYGEPDFLLLNDGS
ncbi:MAG: FG-GAP repeat domain-containing protein, partial [Limisphaerales bacterium]